MSELWLGLTIAAVVAAFAFLLLAAFQGFRLLRRWFRGEAPN
jgi:hypothetical protein